MEAAKIILKYTPPRNPLIGRPYPMSADDVVLTFDPLEERKGEWMKHVLFLPWTTPTRLVGFVHPAARDHVGVCEFLLHAAFSYYGSVAMQPVGPEKMKVVEGPKIVLPYDLIAPLDVRVGACPTWVWIAEQGEEVQAAFRRLLLQQLMPKVIETDVSLVEGPR